MEKTSEVHEVYWVFESRASGNEGQFLSRDNAVPFRSSARYPAVSFMTSDPGKMLKVYSEGEARDIAESFGGQNDWFMYVKVYRVEKHARFTESTHDERFGIPLVERKR